MTKNITLDFSKSSTSEAQELALMPASLAKKLLIEYAKKLTRCSHREIIDAHIQDLNQAETVQSALEYSLEFIQERELINNCLKNNWEVYSLLPEIPNH